MNRNTFKEMIKKNEKYLKEDCLICLDKIIENDKIWNCKSCKIITHLKCIKEWIELLKLKNNI